MDELTLRQQMYSFLSALFTRVPDLWLAQAFQSDPMQEELHLLLADVPEARPVLNRMRSLRPEALTAELAAEYTMLFSGPGGSGVAPYESVCRGEPASDVPLPPEIDFAGKRRVFEGLQWGDSTLAVVREYGAEGFHTNGEIPDSLGLELAFMSYLCGLEQEFRAGGKRLAAEGCAYRQTKFIEEHLLQWVPILVKRVLEKRPDGFYGLAARLVLRYLEGDAPISVYPAAQAWEISQESSSV